MITNNNNALTCHECGLSVAVPPLAERQKALCPRCGFLLTARHKNANDRIIAYAITALIFLILCFPFEFPAFKSNGIERKIDLMASITIMIENEYGLLALIELVTIFAVPVMILAGLIYLLVPLGKGRYPKHGQWVMDMVYRLMPWSMVEIFVVGVLVSLIKIVSLGRHSTRPFFLCLYPVFSVYGRGCAAHGQTSTI